MRLVLCSLLVLAVAAFAGVGELGQIEVTGHPVLQDSPNTDNVIYQVPYAFSSLTNGLGFSSGNSWMMADDFQTTTNAKDLREVEIWAIYATSNATGLRLQIRSNATGPGAILWERASSPTTHASTGDSSWGYAIWYSKATIATPYYSPLTPGTTYWLAIQTVGGSGSHYWCCKNNAGGTEYNMSYFSQNNGTSWTSSQTQWGTAYQQFMCLIGMPVSLSHETWAEIKANF
jgi:hypothetical protein